MNKVNYSNSVVDYLLAFVGGSGNDGALSGDVILVKDPKDEGITLHSPNRYSIFVTSFSDRNLEYICYAYELMLSLYSKEQRKFVAEPLRNKSVFFKSDVIDAASYKRAIELIRCLNKISV